MADKTLPKIDKIATGKNIQRLLRMNHMSKIQLQDKLDMSSPILVYKWCRGEHLPSIEYLLQMSKIFKCKIEDIIVTED